MAEPDFSDRYRQHLADLDAFPDDRQRRWRATEAEVQQRSRLFRTIVPSDLRVSENID